MYNSTKSAGPAMKEVMAYDEDCRPETTPVPPLRKKSIRERIRNWLLNDSLPYGPSTQQAISYNDPFGRISKASAKLKMSTSPEFDMSGITFSIYNANGGKIVEFKRYDEKNDRRITGLHIIPSDEGFAEKIAEIITFECLKGL